MRSANSKRAEVEEEDVASSSISADNEEEDEDDVDGSESFMEEEGSIDDSLLSPSFISAHFTCLGFSISIFSFWLNLCQNT